LTTKNFSTIISIFESFIFYLNNMANENWNIVVDKKDDIQDALKNASDLSKRSTEDLKSFFDEYKNWADFWAIATLATELASRQETESISVNKEVSQKLAADAIKQQEDTAKFQQEINKEKTEENKNKQDKLSDLTAKLKDSDEKIGSLEETINKLLEAQKENREKTSKSLDDVLNAKKWWDTESVKKLKEEIKQLIQDKKELEKKSKQDLLKYSSEEIATMKTKLIRWRWISRKTIKTEDGKETTIKRPNVKINKHRRSRRKLNQVVKAFNGFKQDSDSAVKYILTQERLGRMDNITWTEALMQSMNKGRYNVIYKLWFVMSKDKFEKKFDAQQKKIIDKFKNNINPEKDSPEDKTIKALEDRMARYKQSYMKKHY